MPPVVTTELGRYDSGATVALPSGADGDRLVTILSTAVTPSSFTGWTFLSPAVSNGGLIMRAYHRLRSGGMTTATLPGIAGGTSEFRHYAIFNIEDGALAYVPTRSDGVVFADPVIQVWNPGATYLLQDPHFAVGIFYSDYDVYSELGGNNFDLIDEYHYGPDEPVVASTRAFMSEGDASYPHELRADIETNNDPHGWAGWMAVLFGETLELNRWWVGVAGQS